MAHLTKLQGEAPLLHPCVDGQAVAEVVANWTRHSRRPHGIERDPRRR